MPRSQWNLDRIMRLLAVVAGSALTIYLLAYLSDVLVPFGVAFLLAYMLDPLVTLLQKRVRSRGLAAVMVLLGALLALVLAMLLLVPAIISQMVHLGDLLNRAFQDAEWQRRLSSLVPADWWERLQVLLTQERILATLQNADFWTYVQAVLAKVLPGAWGLLSGSARVLAWSFGFVMVLIYLLFMLIEFGNIRSALLRVVPKEYREPALTFARDFDRIMGQYFRAQTIVAASVGVLFSIAFTIMGLPLGLPFGLFIGALNMVPYLQLASLVPAVLLSLVYSLDTGMPFWQTIAIVLAIYGVIQLIQDLILTPRIMGSALGLSPVAILLSLSVWGKLLGLLGMLLAIPFTCVLIATWGSWVKKNGADGD